MNDESKVKIYFIHSSKTDFNNEIYLPVLRSNILSHFKLVFSQSQDNVNRYYKDIINDSDLLVVELSNMDMGLNMEIKEAVVSGKPMIALAKKSIGYDEKVTKYLKNVTGYETTEEFVSLVEKFADTYKNNIGPGGKATLVLGVLN